MEALETILTRRSVRRFENKLVEKKIIDQVLRAAMSAPSAGNNQPWHFIIVDDRAILNQIADFHPNAKMCQEAPLAIVVCAATTVERYKDFWIQDVAAATENILLAVRALGLGAVWVGVYPREDRVVAMKKLLNIPDAVTPFNIIPIGYSDVLQTAQDRYSDERVHYNRWLSKFL
ncbi:MAG: NADH dehydrogenase [Gammaproteobacteria bacterium GWE2_37_16]|nr:MAG: NADH dehydrogenase [Gammaproteobacteria bacterium GWE2_37_16]